MKIVINKCYGGFGLSIEAEDALIGKCEHSKLEEPIEYYGGPGTKYYEANKARLTPTKWKEEYEDAVKRASDGGWTRFRDGKVICDEHRDDSARTCPELVRVVEALGEAASGKYAKLRVIDIPDGVRFTIEEYDGIEHIAEVHETWG